MYGSIVEHDFWVKNEGSATLKIVKASMTSPLLVTRMPRELAPGGEGFIHFKLDTAALRGPFKGQITVFLNDPDLPEASLEFEGLVIPPVEVSPLPAFFVSGLRGKGASASLEIINHEPQPLRIVKIEYPTEGFTTVLETLQPGLRYKLTLTLKPDGPSGRKTEPITVATSSDAQPTLEITANTFLHERVYTLNRGRGERWKFPESNTLLRPLNKELSIRTNRDVARSPIGRGKGGNRLFLLQVK